MRTGVSRKRCTIARGGGWVMTATGARPSREKQSEKLWSFTNSSHIRSIQLSFIFQKTVFTFRNKKKNTSPPSEKKIWDFSSQFKLKWNHINCIYIFSMFNNLWRMQMGPYEPQNEISNNVVCTISKGSDQPAHMCILIRAFASRLKIPWLLSYWPNSIWSFQA